MLSRRHLLFVAGTLPLAACAAPAAPPTPPPIPVPPAGDTPLERAQAVAQAVSAAIGPLAAVVAAALRVSSSTAARWANEATQIAAIANSVLNAATQVSATVSFRMLSPAVNTLLAELQASTGLIPEDAKATIASIQFVMPIALAVLGIAVGGRHPVTLFSVGGASNYDERAAMEQRLMQLRAFGNQHAH